MVTSCHRNAPIVEKLSDGARAKKETYTHGQAGVWKEEKDVQVISHQESRYFVAWSVPLTPFTAFIAFNVITSMYVCLCDRRVGY